MKPHFTERIKGALGAPAEQKIDLALQVLEQIYHGAVHPEKITDHTLFAIATVITSKRHPEREELADLVRESQEEGRENFYHGRLGPLLDPLLPQRLGGHIFPVVRAAIALGLKALNAGESIDKGGRIAIEYMANHLPPEQHHLEEYGVLRKWCNQAELQPQEAATVERLTGKAIDAARPNPFALARQR